MKNRNTLIDIVKGIAIILMLWGHCIQYCYPGDGDFYLDPVFKAIYSFHMPLLMIMSGYLLGVSYQKYNKIELLSKKGITIIKPIIAASIFEWYFSVVILEIFSGGELTCFVFDGNWLSKLPSLWFLWSVLSATIVICIAVRYDGLKQVAIVVSGLVVVAFFPNYQLNVWMYPYFVAGFYYQTKQLNFLKNICRKQSWLRYSPLIVFPILLLFYEKKHYIYISGLWNDGVANSVIIDLYRWIIGIVGSAFVIVIVQLVGTIQMKGKIAMTAKDFFAICGQKSLQIYILSVVFLSRYLPLVMKRIHSIPSLEKIYIGLSENMLVYDFVFTLVLAVLYALGLLFVTRLLEKAKLSKYVFGR